MTTLLRSLCSRLTTARLHLLLKLAVLMVFIVGNLLNLTTGWADNGDFDRIMHWFVSKPTGFYDNFPPTGSQEWGQRFVNYYLPYWDLDFSRQPKTFISAVLLWAPGVLLNRYFFSAYTLSLPLMSLGARLALLLFLWLLLRWIDRHSQRPVMHYLALGLPLALLLSTADLAAYYNSFFQETGVIVFVPFLLGVLACGIAGERGRTFYLFYAAVILLVALTKSAFFYVSFLALPFVLSWRQIRSRPGVFVPLALLLALVPMVLSLTLTHVPQPAPRRAYNSLFGGTLALSINPQEQLEVLGMADAQGCLGIDSFTLFGEKCMADHLDHLGYQATLQTMLREPQIVLRQLELISATVQDLTLELGRTAENDPVVYQLSRLNLWSELQGRLFPRGWALLVFMVLCGGIIYLAWRRPGMASRLARVALFCLLAFWVDGFVEIWGDGQRDLLKHLLVSNLMFDFMLVAVVGVMLELVGGRKIIRS